MKTNKLQDIIDNTYKESFKPFYTAANNILSGKIVEIDEIYESCKQEFHNRVITLEQNAKKELSVAEKWIKERYTAENTIMQFAHKELRVLKNEEYMPFVYGFPLVAWDKNIEKIFTVKTIEDHEAAAYLRNGYIAEVKRYITQYSIG